MEANKINFLGRQEYTMHIIDDHKFSFMGSNFDSVSLTRQTSE